MSEAKDYELYILKREECNDLRRQLAEAQAEWSVMSRACGNWRTWPKEAASDHEHPDWKAAARAIIERNEVQTKLEAAERGKQEAVRRAWRDCARIVKRYIREDVRGNIDYAEDDLKAAAPGGTFEEKECQS